MSNRHSGRLPNGQKPEWQYGLATAHNAFQKHLMITVHQRVGKGFLEDPIEVLAGNALPAGEPPIDETYTLQNDLDAPRVAITTGGAGTVFTAIITPNGTGHVVLDVAAGIADDASSNPTAAATPVTITQTPGATVEETRQVIADFMTNRANNILASQPDLGSFITGTNKTGGRPLGLLRFNGNEADHGFHFATSLSTIRATHAAYTAARLEPIFSLLRWHRRCFACSLWRPCPAHLCAELTLCRYRYCGPDIAAELTGVRQSP